ncbi:MAG TPA: aspartate kinase [Nannocystis exedens]|nr:aspartate kinase [Nannocystis exedens]
MHNPESSKAPRPAPVVMKFGGSSVADLDRLRNVARQVAARASKQPVVVVVSAMGKTTNSLVGMATELITPPPMRELDMLLTTGERSSMALLAIAIQAEGQPAISLTGSQCGIITDHQHGRARIMEVRPFRIVDELAAGSVVIVGGFQGVSYKREVTTLGRGGSDTTAVALAAALGADCEIYSDVDGVYSADPREVEHTRRLPELDYECMQALARAGAKVLHAQAVELAEEREIAIYARHTEPGICGQTVIRRNKVTKLGVRAIASDPAVALLGIDFRGLPGSPAKLASALSELGLRYLQVNSRGASGLLSQSQRSDCDAVIRRFTAIVRGLGASLNSAHVREGRAMISCIGAGVEERPEISAHAYRCLEACKIRIEAVHTETRSLAFIVARANRRAALAALHRAFINDRPMI